MSRRFTLVLVCAIAICSCVVGMAEQQQPSAARHQGFVIAGVLVNSVTGQPVHGASVVIAPVTMRSSTQIARTGADGRFSFSGLAAGKYSIEATAHGYREQGWNQHDFYATAVVVGRDLDAEHIVFRLQPDAAIDGRVTDEENEPVQNATVRLFFKTTEDGQQKATPRETAETDDQGHYHIGRLAPGIYYLAVSARPWYAQNYTQTPPPDADPETAARWGRETAELDKAYPLTFYPDALDSSGASAIALNPGEQITADVTLQAMKSVHLRVRSGEMKAGAGFQINLKQRVFDRFEPLLQGITMAAGQGNVYNISGIAPGHYLIEMRLPGLARGKEAPGGWYQEVDLSGDVDLSAASSPGFANLSGLIRFQGAISPPREIFVVIRNRETGEVFNTMISPDGQFAFRDDRLRPGSYEVMLGNAQGFGLQKMAVTGATVNGRTLEITTAGTVHLAGIASHGVGLVSGTALRDDKPIDGAMIVLVPQDPVHNLPLFRRDQSDSDGTFVLRDVVPGNYTVVAIDNGWQLEWADPSVLHRYLTSGTPVQITGDGTIDIKVHVQ